MYSTFPGSLPAGLAPGHLFTTSFGGSSGLRQPNFNASLNAGQLPPLDGGGGSDGNPSSQQAQALQSQQGFYLLQTVYHQQQVLQSQLNQLSISLQQVQLSLSQVIAMQQQQLQLHQPHQHPSQSTETTRTATTSADGKHDSALGPHASVNRSVGGGSSIGGGGGGATAAETGNIPRSGYGSSSSSAPRTATPPAMRPATPPGHGEPSVPASSLVNASRTGTQTWFGATSSQTAIANSEFSEPFSRAQRAPSGIPSSEAVSTPTSQITHEAPLPAHAYQPPRRSPSKPHHQTPQRTIDEPPPPQPLPPVASPAPPQPVILSWDPKRYSRSSSIGSGSSHGDPNPLLQQQQHHPRSSGSGLDLGGGVQPLFRPLHNVHQTSTGSVADRSADSASGSAAAAYDANSSSRNSGVLQERDSRAGLAALSRQAPKIVDRTARHPAPDPGVGNATNNAPSAHDISVSDDGYVSMDSLQYMHRFHLR